MIPYRNCLLRPKSISVIRMYSAVLLLKLALIALVLFAMLLTILEYIPSEEQRHRAYMMLALLLIALMLSPVIWSFSLVLMIALILYPM